jgi:hypothetical protein
MNEIMMTNSAASAGLVPANMSEAMRLADMMAAARLVPQALQKSPADCLLVVMQAVRWQMDAFAVAQECSVIQGKLMHSGKLVAAVVNARGNLTQRLSFEYSGDGDNRTIVVSGQLQGEPSPRVIEVVLKNVRTQNKVWQTQPDQQLMYHGVRVWARRHTPELMLGVYSPEEFDDPAPARAEAKRPPIPAKNVMLPAHPASPDRVWRSAAKPEEGFAGRSDAETGEITESIESSDDPEATDDFTASEWDLRLADAANEGTLALHDLWSTIPAEHKPTLKPALDRRHKVTAANVDAERASA